MLSGFLPGAIRIETKHDFVDKPFENSRLMFGKCSALRGDHVFDSGFKKGDQIKLAFAHDRAIRFDQRPFGFVQPKQYSSFLKQRSLR